jgi:hypothetical protein
VSGIDLLQSGRILGRRDRRLNTDALEHRARNGNFATGDQGLKLPHFLLLVVDGRHRGAM